MLVGGGTQVRRKDLLEGIGGASFAHDGCERAHTRVTLQRCGVRSEQNTGWGNLGSKVERRRPPQMERTGELVRALLDDHPWGGGRLSNALEESTRSPPTL